MSPASGHAPDGSPVEFYARLAAGAEPRIIHEAVPAGAALLELGCGAGRITHRLLELGHPVVAVDNSPEMLEYLHGAEKVLSDIQTLDLGRTFAGVVLATHLVNSADPAIRAALLASCARHVAPHGVVLVQRLAPERMLSIEEGTSTRGSSRFHLASLVRRGTIFAATMMYELDGKRWVHSFEVELLGDAEMDAALEQAGLRRVGFLDETRTWVKAVRR
jgi:SAM-dependent methyltransferase